MNSNMTGKQDGTSKLALLRQNRGIKKQKIDIEKAIDGYASSIDSQTILKEIESNSAIVNFVVDDSGSMSGTEEPIAQGINEFAQRQASKIYKTKISLTVFDDEVYPKLVKQDVRKFVPIAPWYYHGGTNIHDALFSAIEQVLNTDANYKLHLLITDGQNGGNSRHTQQQVRDLILSRIARGEYIFLLFNNQTGGDGKQYAPELGINPDYAVNFNRDGDGIKIIFQTIEDILDGLRDKGVVPEDWAKAITAHAQNPLMVKARQVKYLGGSL